ncbi:hypothetical protein CK203_003496 [Vitis vinifera]|uniref:Uncharacterized protein n=1 Tax=Vitis vinifera TaxID=29760 RepID=A0A438K8Y1_VITVI|nr:hypothetical protein CK203_003496 [Vitis vinifera]
MACLHDHSCEDHDCAADWSLYKHIDLSKGFPDCYLISVMFVGNSVLLIGKGEKVGVCASAFAISDFLQYT